MHLTVPQRSVADTKSFPVDPDGVNRWLTKLDPANNSTDAQELYRGLRHSNRLHNDVNRRRAVIACFIPKLRELHSTLLQTCQAQPLPLTREFIKSAQLLDGLLREEAYAFKILLADSEETRADDLRRAMQALARQAELHVHSYTLIPDALLLDANQLFALAEESELLEATQPDSMLGTAQHYKYILLQTIVDTAQHRARQIVPLLLYLRENSDTLQISKIKPDRTWHTSDYAIDLAQGARPVAAGALMPSILDDTVRWLDAAAVLTQIDQSLIQSRATGPTLLGSESLERQSLTRLRISLPRSRKRRLSRLINNDEQTVMIGHKAICAQLHFAALQAAKRAREEIATPIRRDKDELELTDSTLDEGWSLLNYTSQGAALHNADCRTSIVQVGDLISLVHPESGEAHTNAAGKSHSLLGVIRWLHVSNGSHVRIGVEYLARGVMPVGIMRTDSEDVITDDALIISCKVKDTVLQTMLLPAYLYQPGDKLTASLNGKSRHLMLHQPLQGNGLFSHFSLQDA